jgi:hypothetical protein
VLLTLSKLRPVENSNWLPQRTGNFWRCLALFFLVVSHHFAPDIAAQENGLQDFGRMKYGIFVHYVWGGNAYPATINQDGSLPKSLDDLADRFDANSFADDLASMRVEYVIFTAWHANMNCLWPSAKMNQWLPGHAAKRDVLRDMIAAVRAKGIRVILYTHPRDGHDLTAGEQAATGWGPIFDYAKWNNFINDIYGDLISRYGNDIEGLYVDEGGNNSAYVDYTRLRNTIKAGNPNLITLQNENGNIYNCDLGHQEIYKPFETADENTWEAISSPCGVLINSNWWASAPKGKSNPRYSAEAIFRYTVLKAGIIRSAGGTAWGAGNYPEGGWETGVLETMQAVAHYLAPIARSITNTYSSTSYTTGTGSTINNLQWGVATRSIDDRYEYIHVLKPPLGNRLTLPRPADHKLFGSARLVANGQPVLLSQDKSGVILTLTGTNRWNSLDTVIEMTVAGATPFSDSTFADDFSEDAHRLQNTGGNWNNIAGEYCQSNTVGYGQNAAVALDKWSDATYEFDFRILDDGGDASNWAGCSFRKLFPTDRFSVSGYLIYFRANGEICLHQAWTDLASVRTGLAFTNLTHVKLVTCGNNLKLYLNHENTPLLSYRNLSNTTPGYFSLTTGGTHSHFDNLVITPIYHFETLAINNPAQIADRYVWIFTGYSGLTTNADALVSSNSLPVGKRVAFVQGRGSCSATIFFDPGQYRLIVSAAYRGKPARTAPLFNVLLDGKPLKLSEPPILTTNFQDYATIQFKARKGEHTLKLIGGKSLDETDAILFDNVRFDFFQPASSRNWRLK